MVLLTEAELERIVRRGVPSTRVLFDYGYGYRCFPYTDTRGRTVFALHPAIFPPPGGKPVVCKIFELVNSAWPVEIGDLHSLDSNATLASQPFITREGTILVSTQNSPDNTRMAVWRYDGVSWSKVYEDAGTNTVGVPHFSQDPATGAVYGGYRSGVKSRVIKSEDDGRTWSIVYESTEASAAHAYIYGCDAYRDTVVLTKRDKRTFIRSTDGGKTWTESPALPTMPRTVHFHPEVPVSFITSDGRIYYSRDYFASYRWIRIQYGTYPPVFRYAIKAGGRLTLSASIDGYGQLILMSRDLFHTVTPVFSIKGLNFPRVSGFGDFLYIGGEFHGALIRLNLPKALERGFSCPVILWENQSVGTGGLATDHVETHYHDKKTFYIFSDQAGTLYIQAYNEVAGSFQNIDSVSVSANTLTVYMTTYGSRLMRLFFVPSAAATVSAWAILE